MVLGDSVSTISNSMSFSESNFNVQRLRPSGSLFQAVVMNFASFSPSRILGDGGISRCFLSSAASNPYLTNCLRMLYTAWG